MNNDLEIMGPANVIPTFKAFLKLSDERIIPHKNGMIILLRIYIVQKQHLLPKKCRLITHYIETS